MPLVQTYAPGAQSMVTFHVDDKGSPHLRYDGMEITVCRSVIDGVRLIYISTNSYHVPEDEHGPHCRIDLNDTTIYENPVLPVEQEAEKDE